MRVMVRGIVYESAAEAAAALSVTVGAVHTALQRGTADNLGVGREKSIIYKNLAFKSRKDMCEKTGIDIRRIYTWLKVNYQLDAISKESKMSHIVMQKLSTDKTWLDEKNLPLSDDTLETLAALEGCKSSDEIRNDLLNGKGCYVGRFRFVIPST